MRLFDVYSLYDIELVKAKDCYVWDSNGNQYLDLYGGHAVISIGHTHSVYIEKITEQLNQIGFYSNSVKNELQTQLAEKLGKISGYSDYRLFLCNSGAEANENAIKIASFYNEKKNIIAFNNAFHGRTSAAVAITDNQNIRAPFNKNDNVIFLALNNLEQLEITLNQPDICAVIIEGIQGIGGINLPSNDFLLHLERLCKKNNIVLILDEIQSGFGRTGKFFAHQYSGIQPDLITIAKGMGNGFPVAGVLIHPKFKPKIGMLGTTFGGNHLACAATMAVLQIIEKQNLMENATVTGSYIMDNLNSKNTFIKKIRGRGLMIGIEFFDPCTNIRSDLLFNHKIFTGSSSNKNILRILPPLTLKISEADIFLNAFFKVIENH
jgi:acetylornithine aminotransferase